MFALATSVVAASSVDLATAGRRLDKISSFTDSLSCPHHLIDPGVAETPSGSWPTVSRRFRRLRLVQVQEGVVGLRIA